MLFSYINNEGDYVSEIQLQLIWITNWIPNDRARWRVPFKFASLHLLFRVQNSCLAACKLSLGKISKGDERSRWKESNLIWYWGRREGSLSMAPHVELVDFRICEANEWKRKRWDVCFYFTWIWRGGVLIYEHLASHNHNKYFYFELEMFCNDLKLVETKYIFFIITNMLEIENETFQLTIELEMCF